MHGAKRGSKCGQLCGYNCNSNQAWAKSKVSQEQYVVEVPQEQYVVDATRGVSEPPREIVNHAIQAYI